MAKKDLKFFMRKHEEEIVTAPGPDTILGEDGKPVTLEIRVLSNSAIQKINDAYRRKTVAVDKRGNPIVSNGEVVFKVEKDSVKASMHILVAALAYPDLQDPELMAFYDCHDITEMPMNVFPRSDELSHVNRAVMAALGLSSEYEQDDTGDSAKDTANDIKN